MISRDFGLKLGRFGAVGVVSTAIYVGVALIGNNVAVLPAEIVNTVAFGFAAIFSYLGHYHITFRSDSAHRSSVVKFLVLSTLGYGMSSLIVGMIDLLGQSRNLATFLVAIALPILNFILMQFWVFATLRRTPIASSRSSNPKSAP